MRKFIAQVSQPALGVGLAVTVSFVTARLFAGSQLRSLLPLAFIGVLFALGRRYGSAAAVVGSLLSAFVFAHSLFDPSGSWHVQDAIARRNLLWMVMGTVLLSYLFLPSGSQRRS
jgi:K+-sensing histidine kinase KdpD